MGGLTPGEGHRGRRLWWLGPTALALVGGSAVALAVSPGLADRAAVPATIVIDRPASPPAAASPTPAVRPREHHRHHHPDDTPSAVLPSAEVVAPERPLATATPEPGDDGGRDTRSGDGGHDDRGSDR